MNRLLRFINAPKFSFFEVVGIVFSMGLAHEGRGGLALVALASTAILAVLAKRFFDKDAG